MIGYSFWGFLGDIKYGQNGEVLSTPDGNAFYSWSIINEYHKRGKKVIATLEDRDRFGYSIEGANLFSSFAQTARNEIYRRLTKDWLYPEPWEYMLIEWRWPIPGRNTLQDKYSPNYQPDLGRTLELISYCNDRNIPFVVFDLDYKLTEEDVKKYKIKYVIELGEKWSNSNLVKSKQVKIPFDFNYMDDNEIKTKTNDFKNSLVYVGNRYERDWCVDKYIPKNLAGIKVYGNWLEGDKDSADRWKHIKFGHRLQVRDMYDVYSVSVATPLLAKKEYVDNRFMTARLLEAIFYGCVPLFIEEYSVDCIKQYAGSCADFLTVKSKQDVIDTVRILRSQPEVRYDLISYLRDHLRFMDSKFFVDDVEQLVKSGS